MNAIKTETDVVTQAGRSGLTARARNWVAAALVSFAAAGVTILTGGVAGAVVTDPTGGATTTLTDEITGWVTTFGVPMIVGILVVGLVVTLFIKYGKKGAKAAG